MGVLLLKTILLSKTKNDFLSVYLYAPFFYLLCYPVWPNLSIQSLTMKPLTSTSKEVNPARPYSMPLDHLLDALPYIVCAIDANGMFVYINKSAEIILGYTRKELNDKSFFDLLVETDIAKTKK